MEYQRVLREIHEEIRPLLGQGRVVDYIPELASVSPQHFGMALCAVDGSIFSVGEAQRPFSIQSISKVFALADAIRVEGDALWTRVGREPSGTAFNSLVQLELERGVPRNPFINAGALVTIDAVMSDGDPRTIFELVHRTSGVPARIDEAVARGEKETGHRNRALAHFLKSFGNLRNPPDAVLETYFRLCALELSCEELAVAGLFLAQAGVTRQGERVAQPRDVKRLNAVMLTCGVYDEAGDYAYRVGLPAKSGVGGGVLAVLPGHFSVAVWSPGLSPRGNSLAGTLALELLTTKTALSIF